MAKLQFEIDHLTIGMGRPCLVIGEVGQAHDGSLGTAHAFIDAIAGAGAGAVKFQTHIAAAESSSAEQFRVKFSKQDATRYEYWKRMEFSEEQWAGLREHALERGLLFLSSPFSQAAVALLDRIGMPAWKIASGEANNPLLLEAIAATHKPILLSTGMSLMEEIDRTVEWAKGLGLPVAVLQCTSKYPSKPENIGLNMLKVYKDRFDVPVGLSDHSGKIFPGLAAVTMGASIVEVHVTLSREMFGPDVPVSLTPAELGQLVEGVRFIEKSLAHPVGKDSLDEDMLRMRTMFGKSLVAARDLEAGQRLERTDLTDRKPGAGIPAAELENVIGRRLKRSLAKDEFLVLSDLEAEAGL
jgi:N,N'-diacetyllegionaminate synthase